MPGPNMCRVNTDCSAYLQAGETYRPLRRGVTGASCGSKSKPYDPGRPGLPVGFLRVHSGRFRIVRLEHFTCFDLHLRLLLVLVQNDSPGQCDPFPTPGRFKAKVSGF